MAALPVRNPILEWKEQESGEIVVTIPRREDLTGKILSRVFTVPRSRPILLDEVGGFVWRLCDGQHSMAQIVTELCREYKLTRREVELSLNQYIQTLSKRGMIAVGVPEEIVAQMDEPTRRALGIKERQPGEGGAADEGE
jgi:hypothetical protein